MKVKLPSYQIVAGPPADLHAPNVWQVREWRGPGTGEPFTSHRVQSGSPFSRNMAINLAVWLLRATQATRVEVDDAMAQALSDPDGLSIGRFHVDLP